MIRRAAGLALALAVLLMRHEQGSVAGQQNVRR